MLLHLLEVHLRTPCNALISRIFLVPGFTSSGNNNALSFRPAPGSSTSIKPRIISTCTVATAAFCRRLPPDPAPSRAKRPSRADRTSLCNPALLHRREAPPRSRTVALPASQQRETYSSTGSCPGSHTFLVPMPNASFTCFKTKYRQ
jgi:hypothetical protein